ncbi:MAG: rhodanese-like domain-containing protein [Pyrinomonadaceae bacterium MAG19_C2-C3]|nr:rhodanese-like domain-containing protein [Pyrinomonadaceae bacterium MAG19_C2-C3]
MNKVLNRIGLFTNIAIIGVAVLLSGVVVKRYFLTAAPHDNHNHSGNNVPPRKLIHIGSKLTLNGVDWNASGRTLLLAFSQNCLYCTESAPFYRRLAQELKKQQTAHLVAVLPDAVVDAQKYLDALGVQVSEVKQASLNALGVRGTPTLMLINQTGVITGMWVGKLTESQEIEVINQVFRRDGNTSPIVQHAVNNVSSKGTPANRSQASVKSEGVVVTNGLPAIIDEAEIESFRESGRNVVLLDVRDRPAYTKDHLPKAKNIPVDEIEARAINELSPSDIIVTYCRCHDTSLSEFAHDLLNKHGFRQVAVLRENTGY